MPIRPEFRHFYGKEWKTVTRPRILERAGNRCEQCKVPNGVIVQRHAEYPGWWFKDQQAYLPSGRLSLRRIEATEEFRAVRIVLTVAHLNHTPGDDRDDNLKALCQYHHLTLDKDHHRQTRAIRKDTARPLLAQAEARI